MPRLIDADALLEQERSTEFTVGGRGCGKTLLTACRNYLNTVVTNAPTIDAVPVVRCKDCANYEAHGDWPGGYCYHWDYEPGSSPNEVEEDDFCSCGKRRQR